MFEKFLQNMTQFCLSDKRTVVPCSSHLKSLAKHKANFFFDFSSYRVLYISSTHTYHLVKSIHISLVLGVMCRSVWWPCIYMFMHVHMYVDTHVYTYSWVCMQEYVHKHVEALVISGVCLDPLPSYSSVQGAISIDSIAHHFG